MKINKSVVLTNKFVGVINVVLTEADVVLTKLNKNKILQNEK